ncbi:DUF4089 domain-containing protein [Methylobacterium durans]|uniref:DUF4089 domain-containing protein n=1 Tax=Methylobacterium durans TaxID=2202825 RepID=A0A2U8W5Z6_9HYPH|nr:DUF4089 domain-containing protein [Methylobacterium durans]AWN41544.1 DUF4089 domain-containing protein [Methylobacterium durans]
MPEPIPNLDAGTAAAAEMLGIPVEPGWAEAIAANLRVLREAAALVEGFPLPDEAEAAPVFTA